MDVTIEYHQIDRFIRNLLSPYDWIPLVAKGGRFFFARIDDPAAVSPQYDTTLLPPVKWIYPNNEVLLEFDLRDITKAEVIAQGRPQALTFVHPCDIKAINLMDEILAEEPSAPNYLT